MKEKANISENTGLLSGNTSTRSWGGFFKTAVKPMLFASNLIVGTVCAGVYAGIENNDFIQGAYKRGFSDGEIGGTVGNVDSPEFINFNKLIEFNPQPTSLVAATTTTTLAALCLGSAALYMSAKTNQKKWLVITSLLAFGTIGAVILEKIYLSPSARLSYDVGYVEGFCQEEIEQDFCAEFKSSIDQCKSISPQIANLPSNAGAIATGIIGIGVSSGIAMLLSIFAGVKAKRQSIAQSRIDDDHSINQSPQRN